MEGHPLVTYTYRTCKWCVFPIYGNDTEQGVDQEKPVVFMSYGKGVAHFGLCELSLANLKVYNSLTHARAHAPAFNVVYCITS